MGEKIEEPEWNGGMGDEDVRECKNGVPGNAEKKTQGIW